MFDDILFHQQLEEEGDFLPLISVEEEDDTQNDEVFPEVLPVLALKNTVLFPGIVIPITVGRDKSIRAINYAYENGKTIAVLSQRDTSVEEPEASDLYRIGTIAKILKLLKMPDGTITAIIQGRRRFSMVEFTSEDPFMEARIEVLNYRFPENKLEFEALIASILDLAREIIELSPNIPQEASVMLRNINNSSFLLNFIASNIGGKVTAKQKVLEIDDLREKANVILQQMNNELQMLELKDQIENKVRGDLEKQQRDYYLNQQLKTIQEELGQNPQEEEIKEMEARAKKKKWSKAIGETFDKELNKLRRMNPQAPE